MKTLVSLCAGLLVASLLYAQSLEKKGVSAACKDRICKANKMDSTKAVTNPSKICYAMEPGHWRDGVNVPPAFLAESCRSAANDEAATAYQLGCSFDGGISWGQATLTSVAAGGVLQKPIPNCGWQ